MGQHERRACLGYNILWAKILFASHQVRRYGRCSDPALSQQVEHLACTNALAQRKRAIESSPALFQQRESNVDVDLVSEKRRATLRDRE